MKRLNVYFCRLTATAFCITCSTFAILLFANMAQAQENKVPERKFRIFLEESDFRSANGDFNRYILDDGDVIQLTVKKVPALKDSVEVVLKLGANVTWWKGIELSKSLRERDISRKINSIAAEDDDKGPKSNDI